MFQSIGVFQTETPPMYSHLFEGTVRVFDDPPKNEKKGTNVNFIINIALFWYENV